jgi:predicted DNA-binding transcriptional regulator YafY
VSRPTARVLALLEILQGGGTRTVADLAARLDVDERTVRRYVAHLVDLDIPVRSVRGRYGGYRLASGYRMPPLMLTGDEAVAVLLGLVVGSRAGLLPTSVPAAESAAAKLRRVLPQPLTHRLEALLSTTTATVGSVPAVPAPGTEVLLLLAEAARDRRPVAVGYTAADGRQSGRVLHPYGIVAHSGRWYVTGADSASGRTRTFRLDRITAAAVQSGTFDVPAGFDPAGHVLAGLARAPHRHRVALRVHGSAELVRSRFPAGLVTVEDTPDADGLVRVELFAERLDWVPRVLAGTGLPFVVEEPDALRPLVREWGEQLVAAASGGPLSRRAREPAPRPR